MGRFESIILVGMIVVAGCVAPSSAGRRVDMSGSASDVLMNAETILGTLQSFRLVYVENARFADGGYEMNEELIQARPGRSWTITTEQGSHQEKLSYDGRSYYRDSTDDPWQSPLLEATLGSSGVLVSSANRNTELAGLSSVLGTLRTIPATIVSNRTKIEGINVIRLTITFKVPVRTAYDDALGSSSPYAKARFNPDPILSRWESHEPDMVAAEMELVIRADDFMLIHMTSLSKLYNSGKEIVSFDRSFRLSDHNEALEVPNPDE